MAHTSPPLRCVRLSGGKVPALERRTTLLPGHGPDSDLGRRTHGIKRHVCATRVTSKNVEVSVRIRTHETQVPPKTGNDPYDQRSSCTGTRTPDSAVDSIRIMVNGRDVFIWRSVFCDLADLNTAGVVIGERASTLTLTGGDGAENHIVKFELDKESVSRKTLASGMTPNESSEDTNYHDGPPLH